jgi:hypothetical protein
MLATLPTAKVTIGVVFDNTLLIFLKIFYLCPLPPL